MKTKLLIVTSFLALVNPLSSFAKTAKYQPATQAVHNLTLAQKHATQLVKDLNSQMQFYTSQTIRESHSDQILIGCGRIGQLTGQVESYLASSLAPSQFLHIQDIMLRDCDEFKKAKTLATKKDAAQKLLQNALYLSNKEDGSFYEKTLKTIKDVEAKAQARLDALQERIGEGDVEAYQEGQNPYRSPMDHGSSESSFYEGGGHQ